MMPSKVALLVDETGAANTDHTTSTINTSDYDALGLRIDAVGGTFAAVQNDWQVSFDGGSNWLVQRTNTLTAGQPFATGGWFQGCDVNGSANGGAFYNSPVPALVRFRVLALGVGVQARIRIFGRRNSRGLVLRNIAQDGATPTVLD